MHIEQVGSVDDESGILIVLNGEDVASMQELCDAGKLVRLATLHNVINGKELRLLMRVCRDKASEEAFMTRFHAGESTHESHEAEGGTDERTGAADEAAD